MRLTREILYRDVLDTKMQANTNTHFSIVDTNSHFSKDANTHFSQDTDTKMLANTDTNFSKDSNTKMLADTITQFSTGTDTMKKGPILPILLLLAHLKFYVSNTEMCMYIGLC